MKNCITQGQNSPSISYDECLKTLFGLGRFGIKPGLETIRHLLNELGCPEKKFKSIHIAGTNGKGSTAAFITSILTASGISTGLFTSPHLVRFNERFTANGVQISDQEIVDIYERVKKADNGNRPATFFEYCVAMAFCFFAEKKVEYAVIEAGMGGRFDATNVISPCVTLITTVSMDHEAFLGNSIKKIASDKSGIVKKGVPLITGSRTKEATPEIESSCRLAGSSMFTIDSDFSSGRDLDGSCHYKSKFFGQIDGIKLGLKGDHQLDNASLAITACKIIDENRIHDESIRIGLLKTTWPGRIEHIMETPCVILDGAHNPESAQKLGEYLKSLGIDRKIWLITGIMKDKEHSLTLQPLINICNRIITTRSTSQRSENPDVLKTFIKSISDMDAISIPDIPKAIDFALNSAAPSDIVCITGSLYVVGEAKAYFNKTDFQTAPN